VLEVDGFAADRAAQRFPELAQLDQASVQASLSELQQLLPARILGSTLSNHPQLLAEDMAAWREFLDAFGFTQQQMQELLRSCPEAFHQSNVFQVCMRPCHAGRHELASALPVQRRGPVARRQTSSAVFCLCGLPRA
jgi:hypothetical protein